VAWWIVSEFRKILYKNWIENINYIEQFIIIIIIYYYTTQNKRKRKNTALIFHVLGEDRRYHFIFSLYFLNKTWET